MRNYFGQFDATTRIGLSAALLGIILLYSWFSWLRRAVAPFSAERIAWLLEQADPDLEEKLISSVELTGEKHKLDSQVFIDHIVREAENDVSALKPRRVFPFKRANFKLPAVAALVFVALWFVPQFHLPLLVKRMMMPSDRDAVAGRYSVEVLQPGTKEIVEGTPVTVEVRSTNPDVRKPTLIVQGRSTEKHALNFDEEKGCYTFTIEDPRDSFVYWAEAANLRSQAFDMTVLKAPRVDSFKIGYTFPEYTGREPAVTEVTTGQIKAIQGTVADIELKMTQPLQEISISVDGVEKAIEPKLSDDGQSASFQLTVAESGSYEIHLTNQKGIENQREFSYEILALSDQAPAVTLVTPETDLSLENDAELKMQWTARDDFGVASQELVILTQKGEQRQPLEIGQESKLVNLTELG